MIADVDERNAEAREASTRRLDSWGYDWWVRACDALDTPPLRPTDTFDEERESYTASFALMYFAAHMKPRRKADSSAKPASAWSAYSHSRTVLEAYGCLLPSTTKVRRTLRGTLRSFVRNSFDDEVLVPRRKQPFSRAQERALLSILLHSHVESWTPRMHRMLRWAIAFGRCTGARKAELCADGGPKYFSRASLRWYVGDALVAPTPENIARATRLCIVPTASKSDPFNIHWGACWMWFDVREGEHMSVALAMRELELAYPCAPTKRGDYPLLFDVDAWQGSAATSPPPVQRAWLTSRFDKLMAQAIGAGAKAERSWHSWRVTLACSLRAAIDDEHPDGRSIELVKVFGRWRSDSAVDLYRRITRDAYASHVSASLRADATRLDAKGQSEAMHHVDPMDFLSEVDAMASPEASKPTAPPTGAPTPPSTAAAKPAPRPSIRKGRRKGGVETGSAPALPGAARKVIVPASVYPHEVCSENEGAGWSAVAHHHSRTVARVSFTHARGPRGRPFEDVFLKLSVLQDG